MSICTLRYLYLLSLSYLFFRRRERKTELEHTFLDSCKLSEEHIVTRSGIWTKSSSNFVLKFILSNFLKLVVLSTFLCVKLLIKPIYRDKKSQMTRIKSNNSNRAPLKIVLIFLKLVVLSSLRKRQNWIGFSLCCFS